MRITRISARAIQGQSFDHDLAQPLAVFVGRNGAGKTTRLKAVEIGLRGPAKQDKRIGEKGSMHLRIDDVPTTASPTGRIEVLRGLAPKHTLALQPMAPAGTKALAVMQGQLENIVALQPLTFDLGAFTGISADKQRAALLPFATFVAAAEYAEMYPPVPPFEGEAGSDYLSRVRVALQTELNALQGKKLAAEKASVELANKATHGARSADQVRAELATLDARIAELGSVVTAGDAVATERTNWSAAAREAEGVKAELLALGGAPAAAGASVDELRVQLERVAKDRAAVQAVRTWQEAIDRTRAEVLHHDQAIASMGGASTGPDGRPIDVAGIEAAAARLQAAVAEAGRLDAEIARAKSACAAVFGGQMEVLALLMLARASTHLPPETGPMTSAILGDIEQTLLRGGFPAQGQAEATLARLQAQRYAIDLPFYPDDDLALLRRQAADGRQAQAAQASIGNAQRVRADAAQRLATAEQSLVAAIAASGDALAYDPNERDAEHAGVRTQLDAAVAADLQRAQAGSARASAEQRLAAAQGRIDAAQTRLTAAQATHAELHQRSGCGDSMTADLARLRDGRPALQAELDAAIRDEGKVQAERSAFADAEQAKAAIEECKGIADRVKKAQDDCLRKSLGRVADLFAPFCAILGATWRLGDDSPLGVDRAGQFVAFDDLSDSEQLVFGIGLVLALSTTGAGLRLVMLDNLDVCDLERRNDVMRIAADMIAKGHLDQVLGTAWSKEGFDPKLVQIVDVSAAA